MKTRFLFAILLYAFGGSNCYSQNKHYLQIWTKDGNVYHYPVDYVDSVTFDSKSDLRNWQEIMKLPSLSDIEKYNNSSNERSPYVAAWLNSQTERNFTQLSIDFKADYVPAATYCCPVNFYIDYSSLLEKYDSVGNGGGISGYGGLQRQTDGTKYNSILSLWDVYCKKKTGEQDTIRATLINPEGSESIRFDNEGNGVSFRPDYSWEPQKWYRMLIQLGVSETTENTTLEQWIGDISKKEWRQLCVFDLGAPDLKFKGNIAVFLENFNPSTAGDIRTLEFKNVRIYSRERQRWLSLYSGDFYNDTDNKIKKSGSYQYGADDDTFWMITTGVPDCATPQSPASFTVRNSETGSPLVL